jgi:hypothetical protein
MAARAAARRWLRGGCNLCLRGAEVAWGMRRRGDRSGDGVLQHGVGGIVGGIWGVQDGAPVGEVGREGSGSGPEESCREELEPGFVTEHQHAEAAFAGSGDDVVFGQLLWALVGAEHVACGGEGRRKGGVDLACELKLAATSMNPGFVPVIIDLSLGKVTVGGCALVMKGSALPSSIRELTKENSESSLEMKSARSASTSIIIMRKLLLIFPSLQEILPF